MNTPGRHCCWEGRGGEGQSNTARCGQICGCGRSSSSYATPPPPVALTAAPQGGRTPPPPVPLLHQLRPGATEQLAADGKLGQEMLQCRCQWQGADPYAVVVQQYNPQQRRGLLLASGITTEASSPAAACHQLPAAFHWTTMAGATGMP
jgi:hypothetical protein